MIARLFLLFLVTFFAELSLLLWFAERFGWQMALAEVFLTGMLGALIVRGRARAIMRRQVGSASVDETPTAAVLHGVLVVLGGFLLILPGLITDVIGLLLQVSLFRKLLGLGVAAWIHRRFRITSFQQGNATDTMNFDHESDRPLPRIIDVKVVDRPDDDDSQSKSSS